MPELGVAGPKGLVRGWVAGAWRGMRRAVAAGLPAGAPPLGPSAVGIRRALLGSTGLGGCVGARLGGGGAVVGECTGAWLKSIIIRLEK